MITLNSKLEQSKQIYFEALKLGVADENHLSSLPFRIRVH